MQLRSELRFPMIVRFINGVPGMLYATYVARIDDSVRIINRIVARWEDLSDLRKTVAVEREEVVRLAVIEGTFSFITFFFLLVGFHRGICQRIEADMKRLKFDTSELPSFPPEDGKISALRTIRNKMVAHTADVEPRPEDTTSDRLAYLEWYVGHWGVDVREQRLNAFGLSAGGEQSKHATLPRLAEVVEQAQSYLRACESSVRDSVRVFAQRVSQFRPRDYAVMGEYTID